MYRIAAAMDKAVVEGLIPNNPFRALEAKEKPKIAASRREFLTVEELKVLINHPLGGRRQDSGRELSVAVRRE